MDGPGRASHPLTAMHTGPGMMRAALGMLSRRERLEWAGMCLIGAMTALLEAAAAAAVVVLLQLLSSPGAVPPGRILRALQEAWSPDARELVFVTALAAAFVQAAKIGMSLLLVWRQSIANARTSERLATRLIERYLFAPYAFHLHRGSASLVAALLGSVPAFQGLFLQSIVSLLGEGLILVALSAMLVASAPAPALGALALLGALIYASVRLGQRRQHELGEIEQTTAKRVLRTLQQAFTGIKEVKAFGRERAILEALSRDQRSLAAVREARLVILAVPRLWIEGIFLVGMLLVLALLARRSELAQVLPLLGLGAYTGFRAIPSANRIISHVANVRYARAHLQVLLEDSRLPAPGDEAALGVGPLPLTRELALEDVCFSFDGRTEVLGGVSVRIARGQSIGIVGPSGAGKTTIVNLLLGLLVPGRGRITVDGVDVAGQVHAWRRSIGYVPQDPVLLDDTIRRNVAFGVPDAEIDEARLAAAVRTARLEEVLAGLPLGLATVIGERGVRLSGGQRQRIAIARALYGDPPILLFDEATSALDPQTEQELTNAIAELSREKTLVVVAHRIQTVRGCDRLLFLQEGRVTDEGTFAELRQRCAPFRAMIGDEA